MPGVAAPDPAPTPAAPSAVPERRLFSAEAPEMPGRPAGFGILDDQDRLTFERRRLPLRLALLAAPALLFAAYGPAAAPLAAVLTGVVVASYGLVRLLLDRYPAAALRHQLLLRVLDVGLVYVALVDLHRFVETTFFDFTYVLSVVAATATHGRRGALLISGVATIAVLAGRLHLAAMDGRPFALLNVFEALGFGLIFAVTGSMVAVLMRMSGEVVDRHEQAWRAELRARNVELERTAAQLAAANRELEAFAYSVSHDLRAPLRAVDGFSRVLLQRYAAVLDAPGQEYLQRVRAAAQRMAQLIDDLLHLSRVTRAELRRQAVDLSALAQQVAAELQERQPERAVRWRLQPGLGAEGDPRLLRVLLENLLGNAWKFTARTTEAEIRFEQGADGAFCVADSGAGFDMAYAHKLFGAFQRLHRPDEFEGTGIGLATVQRIVHRHGGRVWAEGEVGKGARFFFTLGTGD